MSPGWSKIFFISLLVATEANGHTTVELTPRGGIVRSDGIGITIPVEQDLLLLYLMLLEQVLLNYFCPPLREVNVVGFAADVICKP